MERAVPFDLPSERAVLGAILLDRDAIVAVAAWLPPDYFYLEKHALIYEAMLACYNRREPPDLATVAAELRRQERLDLVGGLAFLGELVSEVPTAVHIEYYARTVESTAVRRRLIEAGGKISAIGYDQTEDLEITLDKAEAELFGISQRRSTQDFVPIGQIVNQLFSQIESLQERRGEVAGVATGYTDLDALTGGLQRSDLIILAARPSVGKCVRWDTLVDDPVTGERLTVEEAVRRKLPSVYGLSERGTVRPALVSDWIDSGVQPCFRVRTRTGRQINVTGHHPFRTVNGWTPLHDLKVGDGIAVPRELPVFGSDESWPLERVRLLAYFIAEGGLTGRSPAFTNTDPVIIEDFRAIIAQQFPACRLRQKRITYVVAQDRSRWTGKGGVMPPNPVTAWLSELGQMGKLAQDKFFPPCVWRWSRRYLAEFLRTLMSCDGSIYQLAGRVRIEFTVASRQLAADVHHAFVRFGLVAKFYQTGQGAWRVEMTDPASVRRYQEQIGWIGEKASRFASYAFTVPPRGSNVGHVPPAGWPLVKAGAAGKGLSLVELGRRSGETTAHGKLGGFNRHTRRSLPQQRLARYAAVLDEPRLAAAASADIYWDEIVRIEPVGEHQVYDLCVPDGASFVAQDICVHNTSLALSLAYNCAMVGNATVGIFSLEMSRDQLVQRILAMHTGIDMQRLRTGNLRGDELNLAFEGMGVLSELPIYIEDTPGLSITEVRSKARRLASETGVDLLMIDYLQLMSGRRSDNRVQEVSEISRGLKALAREVDVPVIALSQLSRAVEGRQSHVPMLSDLRESGCLAGESLVYLPDEGVYRRIDELVGKTGFNVLALNTETWKLEPRPVTNAFSTGVKPVYKLTTRLGRTIRATGNHKFLTIDGWKRLDELTPEERLALPRQLPGPEEATMSDDELALLGLLIGDGCTLARQPIHFTTADADMAELAAVLAMRVFGDAVTPRISPERSWIQVYLAARARLTHGVRNPVAAWLDGMGVFNLRSHEKRVPEQVFAQPAAQIAHFLRHLWATDGCIHSGNGKHYPAIYYASSSVRLAQDVQSLLLRLGISARLRRIPQKNKGRDQYHVIIGSCDDIEQFRTIVGAIGIRKKASLEAVADYFSTRGKKASQDVLPREVWEAVIYPSLENTGLNRRQAVRKAGVAGGGTAVTTQNLSRARATRIAEALTCPELHRLATSDVYWDAIVSIELDGEAEVYDLTVDEHHCFVANAIVAHNSIEQDADIVMFIYREELYDKETDKKGIAEIHLAKHRNGPLGVVPLRFEARTTQFQNLERYRAPEGY
jgi:replicative DNA helicase